MLKEGLTWTAMVLIPHEHGKRTKAVLVVAQDFESAHGLVKRAWPSGNVQRLETSMYEAVVSGD